MEVKQYFYSLWLLVLFVSAIAIAAIGAVTLFYGITADSAEDFPFYKKQWPRKVMGISLLALSPTWLIIIDPSPMSWVMTLLFLTIAGFFLYRGFAVSPNPELPLHIKSIISTADKENMTDYSVIILGGTGQVGAAVVQALLRSSQCREVILITRRAVANTYGERVRYVVMDTDKPGFEAEVAVLVRSCAPRTVYGACCVGIGAGSMKWSEEDMMKLEVSLVGAFARGCKAGGIENFGLLTAVGTSSTSKIRYARVMGHKEAAVQAVGFTRLAIYRPGIIAGNVHTPGYAALVGRLIPGPWGTIDQDAIGAAFVREFEREGAAGTTILHNREMRAG